MTERTCLHGTLPWEPCDDCQRSVSDKSAEAVNYLQSSSTVLICDGCGADMTDEELAAEKRKRPEVISCCPERKMRPVTREDWATLRAENKRLRKALGFYADPKNWVDTPDWDGPDTSTPKAVPVVEEPFGSRSCDCGDTARAALAQKEYHR